MFSISRPRFALYFKTNNGFFAASFTKEVQMNTFYSGINLMRPTKRDQRLYISAHICYCLQAFGAKGIKSLQKVLLALEIRSIKNKTLEKVNNLTLLQCCLSFTIKYFALQSTQQSLINNPSKIYKFISAFQPSINFSKP
jgi:hypothetical protein